MTVLVVAEHDNKALAPSTLTTISAALSLSKEVTLLVAGADCQAVAEEAASYEGVSEVILADHPCYAHQLAENMSKLIVQLAKQKTHLLAPATTFGKNIMPRVAALLDVGQLSDVTQIVDEATVVRPIYAGNAFETVVSLDPIKVMTIRTTTFNPVTQRTQTPATLIAENIVFDMQQVKFIDRQYTQSERPPLSSAKYVIAGGRGLQNAENFALLEQLASQLGAALGASRAAVDAGFVPNDYQVGQTGKVVAPTLYIAVGISGAIQHLAGMKDSKVVVAINKDPDAPIFAVADYGLVGDLFKILPELSQELEKLGYRFPR